MPAPNDGRAKPLIFSNRSIIAWQQGAKTQTRRLVNPQPDASHWEFWRESDEGYWWWCESGDTFNLFPLKRQPYAVGDLLWIREALRVDVVLNRVNYTADDQVVFRGKDIWAHWPWKRPKLSAMFMPRWACRYYARVVSVRPERLRDISDGDAVAEGTLVAMPSLLKTEYVGQFSELYVDWWDSLHKKPGTRSEDNPWAWVYGLEDADGSTE